MPFRSEHSLHKATPPGSKTGLLNQAGTKVSIDTFVSYFVHRHRCLKDISN